MLSEAELEAFLDEALPAEEMARIESLLRQEAGWVQVLAQIHERRDSGTHSLSAIWRRHRISCPTRGNWGSYLLGSVDPAMAAAMEFHLKVVGCRYCQANLADLQSRQIETPTQAQHRRRRYFDSSAGYLPRGE